MAFSTEVKNELARAMPAKNCCRLAELSAILHTDGTLHLQGEHNLAFHTSTENAAVARKTIKLLSLLFGVKVELIVERSILHGSNNYLIYLNPQPRLDQMLNEAGILDDSLVLNYGIARRLIRHPCCVASYLRGAFLGRGFVSDPVRGDYHLELISDNPQLAQDLKGLMDHFKLGAKINERSKGYQLYLKDSDQIVLFLTLVGAFSSLLKWEDVRILRELRNQVNRLVNCDTANLNKSVEAALDQLENISIIEEELGLSNLSAGLREVALVRKSHPQASVKELGEACQPALSKSAVYHRLRRLKLVAESIKQGGSTREDVSSRKTLRAKHQSQTNTDDQNTNIKTKFRTW